MRVRCPVECPHRPGVCLGPYARPLLPPPEPLAPTRYGSCAAVSTSHLSSCRCVRHLHKGDKCDRGACVCVYEHTLTERDQARMRGGGGKTVRITWTTRPRSYPSAMQTLDRCEHAITPSMYLIPCCRTRVHTDRPFYITHTTAQYTGTQLHTLRSVSVAVTTQPHTPANELLCLS